MEKTLGIKILEHLEPHFLEGTYTVINDVVKSHFNNKPTPNDYPQFFRVIHDFDDKGLVRIDPNVKMKMGLITSQGIDAVKIPVMMLDKGKEFLDSQKIKVGATYILNNSNFIQGSPNATINISSNEDATQIINLILSHLKEEHTQEREAILQLVQTLKENKKPEKSLKDKVIDVGKTVATAAPLILKLIQHLGWLA
jgi:hypothetical protein